MKEKAMLLLLILIAMPQVQALNEPDGWWCGNITCSLESQHPNWFYGVNRTWEDMSLLNAHSQPAYAPPVDNQTPRGVWNLTMTLGKATGYYGYLENPTGEDPRVSYFLPNGSWFTYYIPYSGPVPGVIYPYTGPFNVLLNTTFWVRGWVHIVMRTSGEGIWERWLYVNNSLNPTSQLQTTVDPPSLIEILKSVSSVWLYELNRTVYTVLSAIVNWFKIES